MKLSFIYYFVRTPRHKNVKALFIMRTYLIILASPVSIDTNIMKLKRLSGCNALISGTAGLKLYLNFLNVNSQFIYKGYITLTVSKLSLLSKLPSELRTVFENRSQLFDRS